LARTPLRDPAILTLNDATPALDPVTEAAIIATLERLGRQRTLIVVTHRLAAIHRADRIFVVDAGRVVEQGRHHELLARNGLYRELWWKQNHTAYDVSSQRAVGESSRKVAV